MKKQNYNITQSVRFRRWSRASYAVFCSLSACITIGTVCKSICEMSSRKSAIAQNQPTLTLFGNNTDEEDAKSDEFIEKQNQLEQILINNTLSSIAAAPAVNSNFLFIKPCG